MGARLCRYVREHEYDNEYDNEYEHEHEHEWGGGSCQSRVSVASSENSSSSSVALKPSARYFVTVWL